MTPRTTSIVALVWLALLAGAAAYPHAAMDDRDFFETKVRPVLANNCLDCHTDMRSGGLRLDSREAMLKGGKSGPALVPGDPEKSLLIQAVRQTGALKMPKGGKLTAAEIDGLVEWVKSGAVWPTFAATDPNAASVGKPGSATGATAYVITPERRAFWSFQPLRAPQPPPVKDASWARTDIDRFVLARLEREGLKPVGPADRATLIRRATLDLTGVPPTPKKRIAS
jgi:mono/diheme cytochrome c family protein